MIFGNFAVLLSLLTGGVVSATSISSAPNRRCKDFDIPVTVTAQNGIYEFPPLTSNEEATDLEFRFGMRSARPAVATGFTNITGTYNINARFCTPLGDGSKAQIIQILTHGVGFDKSYWDPEISRENNSYIDAAIAQGYSTFSYDRLGNGQSSKPDPNNIVQSFTELAILVELTTLIRNDKLGLDWVKIPEKIVHVGHSYGSVLTNYIASDYPGLSDGIILTGYSHNSSFRLTPLLNWGFQIARIQSPKLFGDFVSQYFTWASKWSSQLFFLRYPFFAEELLNYVEANKQPLGLGTVVTLAAGNFLAANFKGPVLIIAGEFDYPFCGGNCTGILEPSAQYFPSSSAFKTIIHPSTGHGINLHLNAKVAFKSIFDFLGANGL